MAVRRKKSRLPEAEYEAREIIKNSHRIFAGKVKPECVETALRLEKIERIGITKAKKIVEDF